MEKFMKMEKTLMKENKDVIASLGLLVDFIFSSFFLQVLCPCLSKLKLMYSICCF
jgi:hypothetical protein